MRDIEFRAWDRNWYGSPENNENGCNTMYELNAIKYHCDLMQFTGLLDKNGVKIFEGDIISKKRHENPNNWASKRIHKQDELNRCIVVFNDGAFETDELGRINKSRLMCSVDNNIVYEVIGNKYTNPELLEGIR